MKRTLIIEDNPSCALAISMMMPQAECLIVETMSAAIDALKSEQFSAVLLDLQLPDSPREATLESIAGLRSMARGASFIVMTGFPSVDCSTGSFLLADSVLRKPFTTRELQIALDDCQIQKKRECLLGDTLQRAQWLAVALSLTHAPALRIALVFILAFLAGCAQTTIHARTVTISDVGFKTHVRITATPLP